MNRFKPSYITLLLLALSLSACNSIPFVDNTPDYKKTGRARPLEVPPDLTSISASDSFSVPGATTYSDYSQAQAEQGEVGEKLLPNPENVRMERAGSQRWLVVDAPAEKIWPIVREFWEDLGFAVVTENAQTGVMETAWRDPSELGNDINKKGYLERFEGFIDRLSGLNDRQKFRTRLDRGKEPKTTEIYLSHRTLSSTPDDGKNRVRTPFGEVETGYRLDSGKVITEQARANAEDIDAELLRRLMVRLGVEEKRSREVIASVSNEPRANIVKEADGSLNLTLEDQFDRGWRRTGLALDRIGFVVEDRDRSRGVFYVRYFDVGIDDNPEKKKGLLDKLKFWGKDDDKETVQAPAKEEDKSLTDKLKFWKASDKDKAAQAKQYLVSVEDSANGSLITVKDSSGKRDRSSTANRIISLLYEQLR